MLLSFRKRMVALREAGCCSHRSTNGLISCSHTFAAEMCGSLIRVLWRLAGSRILPAMRQ